MAETKKKGMPGGTKDPTLSKKPSCDWDKKAKFGFHTGKDLSKTRTY